MTSNSFSLRLVLFAFLLVPSILHFHRANAVTGGGGGGQGSTVPVSDGPTLRKEERWPLESSEFGEVSVVKINDGKNGCYHLHFITMESNSLFQPVHLYSHMLLYVNSGSGTLNWINVEKHDDKLQTVKLERGDIYRLCPQTVFYMQNNLPIQPGSDEPQKLEIYAIFTDSSYELQNGQFTRVYATIHDLMLGFEDKVLQAALSVREEVTRELRGGKQSLIVQGEPETNTTTPEEGSPPPPAVETYLETKINDGLFDVENNKKAYNILKEHPDVENRYGWSATVTKKKLDVLEHSEFGVLMVNLTKGVMMGPHWNPNGPEVAIVLQGRGIVHVVCPTTASETVCKNTRFRVAEGDVFVVPRYHPIAQISFNDDTFVFMGFTLSPKKSQPEYLAARPSILRKLDKKILAKALNVKNTTVDQILKTQREAVIFECTSCAEEEEKSMEEGGREREGEGGARGWGGGGGGARGWGGGGGGGGRRQEYEMEGEIAAREEEEIERIEAEAEEAVARGSGAEGEGGKYDQEIQ